MKLGPWYYLVSWLFELGRSRTVREKIHVQLLCRPYVIRTQMALNSFIQLHSNFDRSEPLQNYEDWFPFHSLRITVISFENSSHLRSANKLLLELNLTPLMYS